MPISKNKIKFIRSLQQKKFRQAHGLFIAEGEKLAKELLGSNIAIETVVALENWILEHPQVSKHAKEVLIASPKELKQLSTLHTPNQVLLVATQPNPQINDQIVQSDWSLYLDTVQDPGNMGTILRIADWFGIQHVFCTPESVELFNNKVIQASMGAFLRTQLIPISFADWHTRFPNVPTYGAVLGGKNLYNSLQSKHGLLIMGNESKGISPNILSQLQHRITIPAAQHSGMESLNVGVATGIICAYLRQA